MQKLALYYLVYANDDQLLQLVARILIQPLLIMQPSCLASYDNVILQCGKWHYYNNHLLYSYSYH